MSLVAIAIHMESTGTWQLYILCSKTDLSRDEIEIYSRWPEACWSTWVYQIGCGEKRSDMIPTCSIESQQDLYLDNHHTKPWERRNQTSHISGFLGVFVMQEHRSQVERSLMIDQERWYTWEQSPARKRIDYLIPQARRKWLVKTYTSTKRNNGAGTIQYEERKQSMIRFSSWRL